MLVRPTITAPAARSRRTTGLSSRAGGASASTREPARVTWPASSNRSLIEIGMPASGGSGTPAARCASIASAVARAIDAWTQTKAAAASSEAVAASSACSVSSRLLTLRAASAAPSRSRVL